MKFKDVLRELRNKVGLTQQQLAERAGIPLPSLRGHEQGQRLPSWASVVRLARALGVSTDTFSTCEEVALPADESVVTETAKPAAKQAEAVQAKRRSARG